MKILTSVILVTVMIFGIINVPVFAGAPATAMDLSMNVTAKVQDNPASITLTWANTTVPDSSGVNVYRKLKEDKSWGPLLANVTSGTSFSDTTVTAGVSYEYKIVAASSSATVSYISSGINIPAVDARGKLILIVDSNAAPAIEESLRSLMFDLIGDGWQVIRHDVNPKDDPKNVKALIKADYDADSANVKAVYLFGNVPIPLSGDLIPDGHFYREFPADSYYGDMTGTWPDKTSDSYGRPIVDSNGHAIFTPNSIPNDLQLEVGRVDLSRMNSSSLTATQLLANYIRKSHNYRYNITTLPNRALIDDSWYQTTTDGYGGADPWRNFTPLVDDGVNSIISGVGLFDQTLKADGYLFAQCGGPGTYGGIDQPKMTNKLFSRNNYKTEFTLLFGSYFCEWNHFDDILRSPLTMQDYGLESMWAGRPNWYIHSLGMGETFGYGAMQSINNKPNGKTPEVYAPAGMDPGGVYVNLMGDPTIRINMLDPVTNLQAAKTTDGKVQLAWNAAADSPLGYYVYRADSEFGSYTKISGLVTDTTFTDNSPASDDAVYMVRTYGFHNNNSGSYFDLSQGTFAGLNLVLPNPDATATPTPVPTPTPTATQKPTPTPTPVPVIDLGNYQWASNQIQSLVNEGVINGKGSTSSGILFAPGDKITRAELTKLIVKAFDIQGSGADAQFSDVTSGSWYYDVVGAAFKDGIINGTSPTTFNPDAPVTRQDMSKIIISAMKNHMNKQLIDSSLVESKLSVFADNGDIADYARVYIATAVDLGIIQGSSDGGVVKVNPRNNANRAEAAVVIYRMLGSAN